MYPFVVYAKSVDDLRHSQHVPSFFKNTRRDLYTNTLLCGRCLFYILALDNHKLSFENKHNFCIEEFLIT